MIGQYRARADVIDVCPIKKEKLQIKVRALNLYKEVFRALRVEQIYMVESGIVDNLVKILNFKIGANNIPAPTKRLLSFFKTDTGTDLINVIQGKWSHFSRPIKFYTEPAGAGFSSDTCEQYKVMEDFIEKMQSYKDNIYCEGKTCIFCAGSEQALSLNQKLEDLIPEVKAGEEPPVVNLFYMLSPEEHDPNIDFFKQLTCVDDSATNIKCKIMLMAGGTTNEVYLPKDTAISSILRALDNRNPQPPAGTKKTDAMSAAPK